MEPTPRTDGVKAPRHLDPVSLKTVDTARRFAEQSILPIAGSFDVKSDPRDCVPWDLIDEGDRLGLRSATLSPEEGGIGLSWPGMVRVIYELARGDVGVSVIFGQALKLGKLLELAGSDWQRETYLPRFVSDSRFLMAIGITEPETSSDYIIPYSDENKQFATTATPVGNQWVLSGKKHFISNGDNASLFFILAQTDPSRNLLAGSSCFLVERGHPGFSVGEVHNKMGKRLVTNAELVFDECVLPSSQIIGDLGGGFGMLRRFFASSNAAAGAAALGVAEAIYETTISFARRRVQGGRLLIDHPSTLEDLARMRMQLDAGLAYVDRAALEAELPVDERDPKLTALPKVFASEMTWAIATAAIELHGGYGYMRDAPLEKLVRDAAAYFHTDGANRSLRLKAAAYL